MKKMFLCVLAVMLVLSGCGNGQEEAVSSGNTTAQVDWQSLYMDFLIATDEKAAATESEKLYYISLNDLNLDGVPELILSDSGASAANGFAVFQIIENQVEQVWGYSALHEGEHDQYMGLNIAYEDCYTNFEKGWVTLRENTQTGEKQYVITTHNGFYEGAFGSVYSIVPAAGVMEVVQEFTYCDYDENIGESVPKDVYQAGGKDVSKEDYEAQQKVFFDQWTDTGYESVAMVAEPILDIVTYTNKIPLSAKAGDLKDFFNQYQLEK